VGPALIETCDLTRVFLKGGTTISAIQEISLRISPGEFVAIMGPSGAGKSTLLYLLGCLDRPSSGRYLFSGREVSGLNDRELSFIRATRIGFIFQTFNLLGQYTVEENVALPFFYRGAGSDDGPSADAGARVEEAIRGVGLSDRRDHYPSELSGGELQRAAIARALAAEPLLLLADEPTGNLDSVTGGEILSIFRRLNSAGITILMVTHNDEIARRAGRIIRLRDGRLEEGR
jgi:putative ABC transport system ATP-binding protein